MIQTQRATAIAGSDRRSVMAEMTEHRTAIERHPTCQVCERRPSACTMELAGITAVCRTCRDALNV